MATSRNKSRKPAAGVAAAVRAAAEPATPGRTNDPDFMLSLARGLAVMRALAEQGPRLTVRDVAGVADVSRAAARRCLHTLEVLGYASGDQGTYALTPSVLSLASNYLAAATVHFGGASVAHVAQPVLDRVAGELHESSSIAVLDGDDIVYIARAAARRILSIELSVGSRLPAACTSMGRVLLAHLDDALRSRHLLRIALPSYTRHTITDKTKFRKELDRIRLRGYAIVDQELELGLRSIAVPIRRQDGTVIAAVNAGVHVARADNDLLRREFLPVLQQAAADITAALSSPRERSKPDRPRRPEAISLAAKPGTRA